MNAEELDRVSRLIEDKGWSVFDGKIRKRTDKIHDIIINFLSQMSSIQRSLVMDLLSDYYILKDYTESAINILEALRRETADDIKIAPVKVKGATKIKSGDALVYDMDAAQALIPGNFLFFDDPFSREFWEGAEKKVIVDDFIGTGDQFLEMVDNIRVSGLDPKVDYLATIVIQESGRNEIEGKGIPVVPLFVRSKALEQLSTSSQRDIQDIRDIYISIEDNTKCNSFLRFGYMGSEATVTMKKTPDNTLPIFWHDGDNGWMTPFPRKN